MREITNPIIPGFYPDPSIIRVEKDFYLVCSSFELFPGLPVFHSRDLAHWEQVGNAMSEKNGLRMEKNSMGGGLMAPTLRYWDGTYYIINTNFSDKGNYIITAKDPAGPWSKPHWLDDVPGIDASIFFDDDGQAYIIGTGEVWDNGAGKKERGIWLAKYDIQDFKMIGEPITIFNSALRVGASPEAPHIYHVGDYYYLIIAEGGTEHYHAVMVARSKELTGFYEGCPANPVLTHRHLGFHAPITNIGHADLVELEDGSWYAVMLGSRLIDGEYKNLGRETFLCPVIWERDWPVFAPETGKVEWSYPAPESLEEVVYSKKKMRDDFVREELEPDWVFWGQPEKGLYRIADNKLYLSCAKACLDDEIRPFSMDEEPEIGYTPAFLAKRQTAITMEIYCQMNFHPQDGESAGMAIVQAMNHQIHVERLQRDGKGFLRAVLVTSDYDRPQYVPGFTCETHRDVLAEIPCEEEELVLGFRIQGEDVKILYGVQEGELQELAAADAGKINPEKVGCMTGTVIGMYATANGAESSNEAEFDWFEVKD